jgi:GMP synthase (glutamine-hydrolysing)
LLLYKNGETDPLMRGEIGCYERWFSRVLGDEALLETHLAFEAPSRPIAGYDGIILSGSPASLIDPAPWMHAAAELAREADRRGIPVLGVCFGHQLVGWAWGGTVRINPNGWEVGTVEVELTDEGRRDPLFDGLPPRLRVNQSHRDEVATLGPGVATLASGGKTQHQAIRVSEHVRGVQFHPEMDRVVVRRIIEHRRHILDADAASRPNGKLAEALLSSVEDTPMAERVLANWLRFFVKHA